MKAPISFQSVSGIPKRTSKLPRSRQLGTIIAYVILTALAVVVLAPFFWMLSTSLKTETSMFQFPPQWIPHHLQWSNYVQAFSEVPLARYMLNTMSIELFVIAGQLVSCTLIAYGFARFRFRGRQVLFMVMLGTLLIPYQITMIPQFIMFTKIGWVNTYYPLIVPAFFGNPFFVFLLRQYFQSIPFELDEAAKLDGASPLRTLWSVLLPLLGPALMIVVVYTFSTVYNDFLGPLIYLTSPNKLTLALGLANFVSNFGSQWNLLMAGATVAVLPLLILYYFAQNQLIGGVASLGIKG